MSNILEFQLPHEKPPHSRGGIRRAAQLYQGKVDWAAVDRKTRSVSAERAYWPDSAKTAHLYALTGAA